MNTQNKRIAIVADWLIDFWWAELVISHLLEIFPDADIYTSVCYMDHPMLAWRKIYTSWLQKIPFFNRKHKLAGILVHGLSEVLISHRTILFSHRVVLKRRMQDIQKEGRTQSIFAIVIRQHAITGVMPRNMKIWWNLGFGILLWSEYFDLCRAGCRE